MAFIKIRLKPERCARTQFVTIFNFNSLACHRDIARNALIVYFNIPGIEGLTSEFVVDASVEAKHLMELWESAAIGFLLKILDKVNAATIGADILNSFF